MENKKIKILAVPSDNFGCCNFRLAWPAQQLHRDFGDEFDIEIGHNAIDYNNINFLKQFDIIHFHRQFGPYDKMFETFKELKNAGVTIVMDIDDYWQPPTTHPLHYAAIHEKIPEKTLATLKAADYVTTTTDIFAKYIKPINPNVFVMANAIDTNHQMWKDENTSKNDKVRISVICGSSHLNDLELLKSSMNILHNDNSLAGKYQIVLCGYDVRGNITQINPDGSQQTRKILPSETVWNKFEEIVTDNYNPKIIDPEYKAWLLKYKNESYTKTDVYEGNYVRRWTLPLTQYGKHYNYCDVLIAPLDENIFNEAKSELKAIEGGLKNKVLIAQDYGIHKQILTDGENAILIPKKQNVRGWYEAIKKIINDKEYREKLANNLNVFTKERYTLKIATEKRAEIYRQIIAKKQENNVVLENNAISA